MSTSEVLEKARAGALVGRRGTRAVTLLSLAHKRGLLEHGEREPLGQLQSWSLDQRGILTLEKLFKLKV